MKKGPGRARTGGLPRASGAVQRADTTKSAACPRPINSKRGSIINSSIRLV